MKYVPVLVLALLICLVILVGMHYAERPTPSTSADPLTLPAGPSNAHPAMHLIVE